MGELINCDIKINHLTRIEGHGNIRIRIKNGEVEKASWDVVETPRFFEAILVGKHWENAPIFCGRICGICSIGHTLASIRAIENAFGMVPSPSRPQDSGCCSSTWRPCKAISSISTSWWHLTFLAQTVYST